MNTTLFGLAAAGFSPNPILLSLAIGLAKWGAWSCAVVVACVGWLRPALRARVFFTLVIAGLTAIVAHAMAKAFDVPRPFMVGLSPDYIGHGARGSMPSAHASVMYLIALMFYLRRPLRGPAVVLALLASLTGWARVYAGVHFPLDIAAGLLLALAITSMVVVGERVIRALRRQRDTRRDRARPALGERDF